MLQRCEVHHVISSLADAPKMLLPVLGVFAHELGDQREYRQRGQWDLLSIESKSRRNIDVECLRPCRLEGLLCSFGKVGKWCVGCVERKCACAVDGN